MTQPQLLAIIRLGSEMREAQRTYFRTRRDDDLRAAKKIEVRFDAETRAALSPTPVQTALFEEDEG